MEKVLKFEQIKRHLDVGCRVLVVFNCRTVKYYMVISKEESGLRTSSSFTGSDGQKLAWAQVGYGTIDEAEIRETLKAGLWIVSADHPPREQRFKVGDEVEVIKTGERGNITDVYDSNYFVNHGCRGYARAHHELRYPIKGEEEGCAHAHGKDGICGYCGKIVTEVDSGFMSKKRALQEIERLKEYINKL